MTWDSDDVTSSRVHTHGPFDGPGLSCPERMVDGRLRGACMDKLDREANAFAKRVAKKYREMMDAKMPNPGELVRSVQQQLDCVRQEEEWAKLVEARTMTLIYDCLGHRALMVPEPISMDNCGCLPKDWA